MPEFKSSITEAENESSTIEAQEGDISDSSEISISITNLPVVNTMLSVNEKMNTCNSNYKNLLKNHAGSISKLGQEFDNFDKALAESMGLVNE